MGIPLLVHDEGLGTHKKVSRVVNTPVNALASAVSTSTDMELEFPEVWQLVIGVEGTQEHR